MKDQATNLRILAEEQRNRLAFTLPVKQETILVVSGKGGVGKSFISLHLAYALTITGKKVLLVDANLYNPSLHIITNKDPVHPLNFLMNGNSELDEKAVIQLSPNLDLIANLPLEHSLHYHVLDSAGMLFKQMAPLVVSYDYMIIDTQTGLNEWNLSLLQQADLGILVSISDPTSVIDTYTLIKTALAYLPESNFQLVINQIIGEKNGLESHQNLNLALRHFLNYEIELLGMIPFDMAVKNCGFEQKPVWESSKKSTAMRSIEKIAKSVLFPKPTKKTENQTIYQEVNL